MVQRPGIMTYSVYSLIFGACSWFFTVELNIFHCARVDFFNKRKHNSAQLMKGEATNCE